MCLYPKLILNRKYLPNKKNGGNPPPIKDNRTKYVPVGCGKCMECRRQKKNEWTVRLSEDIRHHKNGKFVTMTFSDESLTELESEVHRLKNKEAKELNIKYKPLQGYELENAIGTLAVRRFTDRYIKEIGKSVRHWLVTELGQQKTERLHIHGIIWTDLRKNHIEELWKYGNVNKKDINWEKNYVTERTVNYIVKYLNKADNLHEEYIPVILCSAGIGRNYIDANNHINNTFRGKETREYYKTRQGFKMSLPKYYRNKIYTEDEKEYLWMNLLDKNVRWVNGMKVDISNGDDDYYNVLKYQREINKRLGYGNDQINWDRKMYEQQRRNLLRYNRITKINKDDQQQRPMSGSTAPPSWNRIEIQIKKSIFTKGKDFDNDTYDNDKWYVMQSNQNN